MAKPKAQGKKPKQNKPKQGPSPRARQNAKDKRRNNMYGATGDFKGVSRDKAAGLVNADIRTYIDELRREAEAAKSQYGYEENKANTLYNRTKGDLDYVYGEADEYIGSQNGKIDARYNQSKTAAQAAQQALLAQLGGNGASNTSETHGELARLGMDGGQFTQRMGADQQYALGTANQTGANNQANLNLMQLGSADIGQLLLGMNKGSQTSAMGRALNNRNDLLSDISQSRSQDLQGIRGEMRDIRGQRGGAIKQMLEQLVESQFGRYAENRTMNFNERMAQQSLNLDRRSLNHSIGQDNAGMRQQNAYNSTLANLAQTELAGSFGKGRKKRPAKPKTPSRPNFPR